MKPDFLMLGVSRGEVESGDISGPLSVLQGMLDRESAIQYCERVDICVGGYDDDPRELYEIPEVRDFMHKLDAEFPYWLYFLSKGGSGLLVVLLCFCSPHLAEDVRQRIWKQQIADYLINRGLPAMNQICHHVGCSEAEIRQLTERVTKYIVHGRDVSES